MKTSMICAIVLGAGAATAMADITKNPDLGNFWNPLNPTTGTYVYANSFVADDNAVSDLGMWLDDLGTGGASVRFEVWGDAGGPDASNVIASTGSLAIFGPTNGLAFYSASASGSLTSGNTYWFAATVVGESGPGYYQVGGHTQNSQYNDNGTFWYSNDPAGINFDGQNLTPEMAFHVGTVPAPGALALLGLGGLAAARRRR